MLRKLSFAMLFGALLGSWSAAGSIFDDQDPTPASIAPNGGVQRPNSAAPNPADSAAAGEQKDVAAQEKCDASISNAEQAYQAAVLAAKKQLLVDLDAAMDDAMAHRDVDGVKRSDAAITTVKTELGGATSGAGGAPGDATAPQATRTVLDPHVQQLRVAPRTIVFACDCTGSMITKIAQLKIELSRAVQGLSPSQSFDVMFYQDEKVLKLDERLIAASPDNKLRFEAWLEDIVTAGTTDPVPALTSALKLRPEALYFLTDAADFPDAKAVQGVFREFNANHHTRVNTILFVADKDEEDANKESEPLMRGIAQDNGGVFKWVRIDELK